MEAIKKVKGVVKNYGYDTHKHKYIYIYIYIYYILQPGRVYDYSIPLVFITFIYPFY